MLPNWLFNYSQFICFCHTPALEFKFTSILIEKKSIKHRWGTCGLEATCGLFEIKKKLNLNSNNFTKVTFISIETYVASFVTAILNVASQGKKVPTSGIM